MAAPSFYYHDVLLRRNLSCRVSLSLLATLQKGLASAAHECPTIMGEWFTLDKFNFLCQTNIRQLDFFQINFTVVWFILAIELIVYVSAPPLSQARPILTYESQ